MRRVVLLGGGHAHVHVLSRAALAPLPGAEIVLVSPFERHHYSGMVPGYLQGTYGENELAFDLRAIAARAGARFVQAKAERIDAGARTVELNGERLSWDLLSVDVGSEPAGLETPGAREHAYSVRPMSRAVALRRRAEELLSASRERSVAIVVVGGGAAGVEVALALERLGRGRGSRPDVTIVEAEGRLLAGFSSRLRRLAEGLLFNRRIHIRTGRTVSLVRPEGVGFDDGTDAPSDLTIWLTGAAPPALFARSDVPKDPHGFLFVDETLRAVDGAQIFGAGDCIGIAGHPSLAKAGVYAVREAPVLEHNLRAALEGRPLRRYRPQESYLALMNSADGSALWRWHALSGHSAMAWRAKNAIDRAFMRRYQ
jgi:selenide,water dikinase